MYSLLLQIILRNAYIRFQNPAVGSILPDSKPHISLRKAKVVKIMDAADSTDELLERNLYIVLIYCPSSPDISTRGVWPIRSVILLYIIFV